MRHTRTVLRGLVVLLFGVLGCRTPLDLKPPPQDEGLNTPPLADSRYSKPGGSYPKEELAGDASKPYLGLVAPPPLRSGGKAGGGMGGMGGMPGGF